MSYQRQADRFFRFHFNIALERECTRLQRAFLKSNLSAKKVRKVFELVEDLAKELHLQK
jgi:hypothetical protein